MDVPREHIKQVKQIIRGMSCRKNFKCYTSDFEDLCKARDLGMENFLECHEKESEPCEFSFPFGKGFFCKCPLRYFVAKNLEQNE